MAVVGIDLGTGSLGAVVCSDGLALLGAASRAYPVSYPAPGRAEQDPRCWEAALAPAIGEALAAARVAPSAVRGVAIAAQLDGCVAVDDGGAPRGPCLIWSDRRATAELAFAAARAPAVFAAPALAARTGQIADAAHLAAKIAWHERHAPGAVRYHQPTSYLLERLTGEAVIDPALASTTMLYALVAADWDEALLDAFAIARAKLPRLAAASSRAGVLHAAGAALTGLPAGTPVAVGTGDDFASALGAGLGPGQIVCVLGTAEVVGGTHPIAAIDQSGLVETHPWPGGGYFVENPGWLAGGAVAWAGALLGLAAGDAAGFDAVAAAAPPGADGVTFLPALAGSMAPRWHAGARGGLYGLTPASGRAAVARAVLEGCAFACRDVAERLTALGVAVDELVLCGGGAASALWAEIHADVTGLPVSVAADRADTGAIGAAVLASVAAGVHGDLTTAIALRPPPRHRRGPRPSARAACDDGHRRYRALFAALEPLFSNL